MEKETIETDNITYRPLKIEEGPRTPCSFTTYELTLYNNSRFIAFPESSLRKGCFVKKLMFSLSSSSLN